LRLHRLQSHVVGAFRITLEPKLGCKRTATIFSTFKQQQAASSSKPRSKRRRQQQAAASSIKRQQAAASSIKQQQQPHASQTRAAACSRNVLFQTGQ